MPWLKSIVSCIACNARPIRFTKFRERFLGAKARTREQHDPMNRVPPKHACGFWLAWMATQFAGPEQENSGMCVLICRICVIDFHFPGKMEHVMLTAYERFLITGYLANIASRLHPQDRAARKLIGWASGRKKHFADSGLGESFYGDAHDRLPKKRVKTSAKKLRRLWKELRAEIAGLNANPDLPAQRLQRLGETTSLNGTDIRILELLLRFKTNPVFKSMIEYIIESPSGVTANPVNFQGRGLSLLLGLSANSISDRLHKGARLIRTGLVDIDSDGDLQLTTRLRRLVTTPGDETADVVNVILDVAAQSDLEWPDFDHVADSRNHVEALLKGALDSNARGINILLYGPPGTGKTEFCKVLARQLGATLYTVGESDDSGEEPSRRERLQDLRLAEQLLADSGSTLLLFDEMEDLLDGPHGRTGFINPLQTLQSRGAASKVFMHRLLENTSVPILWTMNDARDVNPAILRRMMFALELRLPTTPVRARVWARQLDRHGIKARPEEVRALAAEFDAPPGVAAGATAAASLAGGDVASVCRGVRSLSRLLSCGKPSQGTPAVFDPGLIRSDIDTVALADQLERANTRRFSLCLQGPPGTGKSAFVRYLAERLGLAVLQKRTSDLKSMWVGETERLIALSFAEARDSGVFLVFDEADSLLASRRTAEKSWEISQVNEMLTWMESHPLPFACTTNFGEHFDPATLRRFVFKITLDFLAPEQVEAAFRSFFDLPPPASLATLDTLTPGDFAVVHRKADILGRLQDPEELATMLRAECTAKPDRPQVIGFRK